MFNIPIPRDMDGRVLIELFNEKSTIAKQNVKYQNKSLKEEIKKKIQIFKLKLKEDTW